MKSVKIVAGILKLISYIMSAFYLLTSVYGAIVIIFLRNPELGFFTVIGDGSFKINYPFSNMPFLVGDNTARYLLMLVVTFLGYGIFALLLGKVFWVFTRAKLFTSAALRWLKVFYLYNFIAPLSVLILNLFFTDDIRDYVIISILHAIIGVFAWFFSVMFKQALFLQEEQDLTL